MKFTETHLVLSVKMVKKIAACTIGVLTFIAFATLWHVRSIMPAWGWVIALTMISTTLVAVAFSTLRARKALKRT